MNDSPRPNPFRYYLRAMRLRCPVCGRGRLFRGWFRMNERCSECKLDLVREPGYYLGSIYFNYGLTAVLVTAGYFVLFLGTDWPDGLRMTLLTAFAVLFPIWNFRRARATWLAFDRFFDRNP